MHGAHLNLDSGPRVGVGAMASGLLDELPPVGQNQSLRCIFRSWLDPTNELGEDNLRGTSVPGAVCLETSSTYSFTAACGQGNP